MSQPPTRPTGPCTRSFCSSPGLGIGSACCKPAQGMPKPRGEQSRPTQHLLHRTVATLPPNVQERGNVRMKRGAGISIAPGFFLFRGFKRSSCTVTICTGCLCHSGSLVRPPDQSDRGSNQRPKYAELRCPVDFRSRKKEARPPFLAG